MYNCDNVNFIKRKKGTISANHSHEDKELLYLIEGKIELTIQDETRIVKAPVKITIEPNQYYKLVAFSDIEN